MMEVPARPRSVFIAAALLMLVFFAEMAFTVHGESLSWDEGDHIFAGYMSLKHGDLGFNPEHPPLVKMLAAIPLMSMGLKEPALQPGYFKTTAYMGGRDLIYENGGISVADRIIFRARMAACLLSLLLAVLVFAAGYEMFGAWAGLFALALLVFEPNIVAHGAFVTTDMGLSCFLFATVYALYRYVKSPSYGRMALMGLAAGLALASKHSAILLLPMVVMLAVSEVLWPQGDVAPGDRANTRMKRGLRLAGALAAASALALLVLWAFYGFRFGARPGGLALDPPLTGFVHDLKGHEAQIILSLARWHILPESYLYGLADVRLVANFMPSYLFGKVYEHGLWYYFPTAFLIKSTAAFLILLVIAKGAIVMGKLRARREILFLSIPPFLYLVVAMSSSLNIGARHILPMYAFLIVLIVGAAQTLVKSDKRWAYALGVLLLWHAASSARAYPNYIAYSNEFWGGPANTHRYLTDSNTDWGQQLKDVKLYVDRHNVKQCWFAYFVYPAIRPSAYGIPCAPLPTPDSNWFGEQVDTPPTVQGTVFISAADLTGYELGSEVLSPYRAFETMKPTAVIRDGVFVYDGTFDMRFASALGHVKRSQTLAEKKQLDAALAEAQTAVELAPESMQAQMQLGDTLTARGRKDEARPAYEKALAIAKTMEPSAQSQWIPQVENKIKEL